MEKIVARNLLIFTIISLFSGQVNCADNNVENNNITGVVFGQMINIIPAAFGDYNSDELTDIFVIKDDFKTIQILYARDNDKQLLVPGPNCSYKDFHITSIVPGDFDGDAFMDLLFTVKGEGDKIHVYINWGGPGNITCAKEHSKPVLSMRGEPLALDYDNDMIVDLFGADDDYRGKFWIFKKDARENGPEVINFTQHGVTDILNHTLVVPHSNAVVDLNNDFLADLVLTIEGGFIIWYGTSDVKRFEKKEEHKLPVGRHYKIGQSMFLDVELNGNLMHLVPVCFDNDCNNSTILVHHNGRFHNLEVNFKDPDNVSWKFLSPNEDWWRKTISLRGGDFNLDGYPDLLATLISQSGNQMQTFFLENVPCRTRTCNGLTRTFEVHWKALRPFANGTIMGSFYDFYQDGILDIIMLQRIGNNIKPVAFRNNLDYDANFVKVIVLTGLSNVIPPNNETLLVKRRRTYGSNLPGPRIEYVTTTQEGDPQHGASAQLPQSAYLALHLPFTTFGLGRTPNFVDSLTVGLANRTKIWTQIIPNSQMIVIPNPVDAPERWKAQLFVTPSKLILMSVVALSGVCLVILLIIVLLYCKEKREDKIQKSLEAHRFHFDAM